MTIDRLTLEDIGRLRVIHEKYYNEEFSFPDFTNKFISHFVVSDDSGDIICGGGVRTILESLIITDKSFSVRDRREALYKVLQASLFAVSRCDYNELHAFIQDEVWLRHLKNVGFKETKGKSLVLGI